MFSDIFIVSPDSPTQMGGSLLDGSSFTDEAALSGTTPPKLLPVLPVMDMKSSSNGFETSIGL